MGDEVPHGVDRDLINTPLQLPLYDLSYIVLAARNTSSLRKLTE
jgi:hypothetical protein